MGLLIDRDDAMVALKELKIFEANIYDNFYNIAIDKCVDKLRTFPAEIGLDGWKLAKRLMGLSLQERQILFDECGDDVSFINIANKFTALEVERRLKSYEKRNNIKPGDVIYEISKTSDSEHYLVVKVEDDVITCISGYDFSPVTLGKKAYTYDYTKMEGTLGIDKVREMFEK